MVSPEWQRRKEKSRFEKKQKKLSEAKPKEEGNQSLKKFIKEGDNVEENTGVE